MSPSGIGRRADWRDQQGERARVIFQEPELGDRG